jgi:hypothetical protein
MSEIIDVLIKEQRKITGKFIIKRQEIVEKNSINNDLACKVITYKLFGVIPIYRSSTVIVQ